MKAETCPTWNSITFFSLFNRETCKGTNLWCAPPCKGSKMNDHWMRQHSRTNDYVYPKGEYYTSKEQNCLRDINTIYTPYTPHLPVLLRWTLYSFVTLVSFWYYIYYIRDYEPPPIFMSIKGRHSERANERFSSLFGLIYLFVCSSSSDLICGHVWGDKLSKWF